MLTKDQKEWVNHLTDTDEVVIVPFDPKTKEYYKLERDKIRKILGEDVSVIHSGATSLGISGQGDVDIYIPVSLDSFNEIIGQVKQLYGSPRSKYSGLRARFVKYRDGTKIEVFVINRDSNDWIQNIIFNSYLKDHPKDLETYRLLKEKAEGVSTREYYRRKIEFINKIIKKAKPD